MILSRRSAWYLLAFAVWNAYVWATFVWNVFPQHHWDTFFLIHLAIGGLTTLLGFGVGAIGVRRLRRPMGEAPQ